MEKITNASEESQVDEKRAINVAEAMINAAREEAQEKSEILVGKVKDPELARILRGYYEQGYLAGVLSIIQKEIYDRLAQEIAPAKAKADHAKRLGVAQPGTKKARRAQVG